MLIWHLYDHGPADNISGEDGDLSDRPASAVELMPFGRSTWRCMTGTPCTIDEVGGDDKSTRALAVDFCSEYSCDTHYTVEPDWSEA